MPDPGSHDEPRRTRLRSADGEIELRSSAFTDHTLIPDRYSGPSENLSPPLEWRGIPDGTEEIALLCQDPDAPGGTFTHWVVSGISPETSGVCEGAVPTDGQPGRNGFGSLGWGGPAPPAGEAAHRYFFHVYAADRPLGLDEGVNEQDLLAALDDHVLGQGTLVGLFGR